MWYDAQCAGFSGYVRLKVETFCVHNYVGLFQIVHEFSFGIGWVHEKNFLPEIKK